MTNPRDWPDLERYVKDVLGVFAADSRMLMWDLYNERNDCALRRRIVLKVQF
jgi:hypothetical protein